MEEIIIHYIDDDDDDRLLFLEASSCVKTSVLLNLYERYEDLFHALKNIDHKQEIVILDINMPRKDGLMLLKEIRENKSLKKLPVIMYSTSKTPKIIKDCLDNGASLYIVKPSSFTDLQDIIKKLTAINWASFKTTSKNFVLNNSHH